MADLHSLSLVQRSMKADAFEYLSALQNLRYLDLSLCTMEDGEDMESRHIHLVNLVQRLPKLVSLDISYTRFGGIIQSLKSQSEGETGQTAVLPGLEGREFEFLGLWKVIPDVCGLHDIPAIKITGTACEEQIINALYVYQNNIPLLKDVMAHIKDTELDEPKDPYRMLKGVKLCLRTLQSKNEEALIMEVFLKLFYNCYRHIPQIQRREILELILIIINKNIQPTIEQIRRVGQISQGIIYPDKALMLYLANSLLTGYFANTAVYSYCFEQYVDTLCTLLWLMNPYYDGSSQYTVFAAHLLNQASYVGVDYNILMGEMGIIQNNVNSSDEQKKTVRGMMGTLTNVSEVQSQRTKLMNKDFIMAVRSLLQHTDQKVDIDTSIHCVYILLQMLSFRPDKWMDESISPLDVLVEVRKVIFLWDVTVERETAYTSLLPIFTLLECQVFPKEEAQYVAAWILCNLTTVKPERYCDMLRRENGEEIIRRVYSSLGEGQDKTKKLLTDIMLTMGWSPAF